MPAMRFRDSIQSGYELKNFIDWEDIFRAMTMMRAWNNEWRAKQTEFQGLYDADSGGEHQPGPVHEANFTPGETRYGLRVPARLDPPPRGGVWIPVQNLRTLLMQDNGYGFNNKQPYSRTQGTLPAETAGRPDSQLKKYSSPDFYYDAEEHKVTFDRTNGIFVDLHFTTGRQHRATETRRTACSPTTYCALLLVVSPPDAPPAPPYTAGNPYTPTLRSAGSDPLLLPPRFRCLYHKSSPRRLGITFTGSESRSSLAAALEEYGLGQSSFARTGQYARSITHNPYPGTELRPGDSGSCGWGESGGHAFYIFSIRYHDGKTWYQILSAQRTSSGIGLYGFTNESPGEYADLPDALVNHDQGVWWCAEEDKRAARWSHVTAGTVVRDRYRMSQIRMARCWRRPRMPIYLPRPWLGGNPDIRLVTDRWNPNPRRTANLYHANNSSGDAGFYPFAANRVWHGGIHLYPEDDRRVCAAADGRICAIRFDAEGSAPAELGGKSRNFILIRHDLPEYHAASANGTKHFYSLYMHLENEAYDPEAPQLEQLWWRGWAQRLPQDLQDRFQSGEVVTFEEDQGIHVQAGDVLGHVPEHYDLFPDTPPTLHFEIFAPEPYFPGSYNFRELVDDDDTACVEQARFTDAATDDESRATLLAINQVFIRGNRNYEVEQDDGTTVTVPIWTREELSRYYSDDPSAVWLRAFATRHISEWGDRVTYDGLRDMMCHRHLGTDRIDAAIAQAQAFAWWTDEVSGAVGLPEDQKVWHYHPIRFLVCLNRRMEEAD
jgi:hypothetical protein